MLRVVLSGVESTGKTILAGKLSGAFRGVIVPEYGRYLTDMVNRPLTLEDHHAIACGHRRLAAEAAAHLPLLLIEDTDIVMTTAWATMLFGRRDPQLAATPSQGDLHLLFLPDTPFIQDRLRMFGEESQRQQFHAIVEAEFDARGIAPVRIGGSFADREARAFAAVRERLS
jgi:NadR type nicotinamide-nucleotide adenylyltransferase